MNNFETLPGIHKNEAKKMSAKYDPQVIESKWLRAWQASDLYRVDEQPNIPKYYCLDFFPYPSGDGLHVGHCRNYVPTDVISRYMRMHGYNVLHPMGWDAFGEPTEQYAITHGIHPRETTDRNTANFRHQMENIGTSYDWSREIDSSKPEFYRWTQWFFLKLYENGLAYRDTSWQWWCPTCQTTQSSHEAAGGTCWRGHTGVEKRQMPAWYFRITDYADQLLVGLDEIDWPEPIKTIQQNWIGRSEGCQIDFKTELGGSIPVFTTRPETVFGATFFCLAPEHPAVHEITRKLQVDQVDAYIMAALRKSEVDRQSDFHQKTGVFTGGFVSNPVNDDLIPVWIADYVLPSYGSGAVMGVPAHDERDFQFAVDHELPVKPVVISDQPVSNDAPGKVFTGHGVMIDAGPYTGLHSQEASQEISDMLEAQGLGKRMVQYRMHDWLISRQRYWGTPIPIVYCDRCGEVPVPEENLPVLLPEINDFIPDGSGRSPLSRQADFVNTACPNCKQAARRETDTMGGFACSSWYFLRFTSPHYCDGPFDPDAMRYWSPVDLYVGGVEHAVLHLLYARFWTHFLADQGLLPFREPFTKLLNQGQMMGTDGFRMSKSRGNVISPDLIVAKYGADALRVYELFMAPFNQDVHWSEDGIQGARRFLNRFWRLYAESYRGTQSTNQTDTDLEQALNQLVDDISRRIESQRFNTMLSSLMEFVNLLYERFNADSWHTETYQRALETLLLMMAPIAPFITEELWQQTGHQESVHLQDWPTWDPEIAEERVIQIPVQINGKKRAVIEVEAPARKTEVEKAAFKSVKVQQHISGQIVKDMIYIPGKILNIRTENHP
jgi:leucyl-tRNA synthetase